MDFIIRGCSWHDEKGALHKGDIAVKGGDIAYAGPSYPGPVEAAAVIDGRGLVASCGFTDMHVHLREPGYSYKEDIVTGTAAAAAGGFTRVLAMPNTDPVVDCEKSLSLAKSLLPGRATVEVLFAAAVTAGQKSERLTDFAALKKAGAAALSDDGYPVKSALMMRKALKKAKACGLILISHCEEPTLAAGSVHDGDVAKSLKLCGIPASCESVMVARECALSLETQAPVHIAHVSGRASVEIIRLFKRLGAPVTCETAPHYFSLTHKALFKSGTNAKMNPPLKTEEDRLAVIEGLADGTIDVIATDHAPHAAFEKAQSFDAAPNGIVGLETALPLCVTYLVEPGHLTLFDALRKLTDAPSSVLGLPPRRIAPGMPADLCLFDPAARFTVDAGRLRSKSKNTPYDGMTLTGRVTHTLVKGRLVYETLQTDTQED